MFLFDAIREATDV